jgi:hypothetical protein
MKKTIFLIAMTVTINFTGLYQKATAQTGSEILKKAIAFQDPQQKWNDYSGKVNLMTVWPNGSTSGGEVIEIQTKENFYRCTNITSKVSRGIKNGEYFLEENGQKKPVEDQRENIRQMKSWHYFHFGILMELEASGLVLENKVETLKFQGNECLVIQFNYDPGKIKNENYKESNWTIYIDPNNYSMKGLKVVGVMNLYAVFAGNLSLNGIIIPLCRTYFKNEDNSFYMADIFTNPTD